MTKGQARGNVLIIMYNFIHIYSIYSYLSISKPKQVPHVNILVQNALCIISKYIDLCSATSDYLCML